MKKLPLSIITTSFILLSCMNILFSQSGYTVGLNGSYPVVTGSYFTGPETRTGPSVGVHVGTPYSFDLGPYSVGVGLGIEIANLGAVDGYNYTGYYLSLSTIIYELSSGPISILGSFGMYDGLAATGAVMYDLIIENVPLVLQPYARTTVLFDASGEGNASYLMSIGAMINYSF